MSAPSVRPVPPNLFLMVRRTHTGGHPVETRLVRRRTIAKEAHASSAYNFASVSVVPVARSVGRMDNTDRRTFVGVALDAARERVRAYRLVCLGARAFRSSGDSTSASAPNNEGVERAPNDGDVYGSDDDDEGGAGRESPYVR